MIDTKSTTELVKDSLKEYVKPLTVGDTAYVESLSDELGRPLTFNDDFLAGKFLIIYFVSSLKEELINNELTLLREKENSLRELGANIVVISADANAEFNRQAKANLQLTFPVLADPAGVTFAGFGLERNGSIDLRVVVLSPDRRVRSFIDFPMETNIANLIRIQLKNAISIYETSLQSPHPPILIIPNVLTAKECDLLVKQFESKGDLIIGGQPTDNTQDYKFPVYDQNRQDRINHMIADKKIISFLEEKMLKLVNPMIKKAFSFDVQKREPFFILRYVKGRSGLAIGHRDNQMPATAHRRFAFTLNLSSGNYSGGNLTFKEYTNRGYDSSPGTAIVFSSSLLHEVEEITEGVRYCLITHLF
ncbi:MAG: redoxin domain-containing protein [Kangiellaceae bacterium]